MIAIQKIGKSFLGALNYNLKKLYHPEAKKRAELLDSNFTSIDSRMIQRELSLVRSLRPNLNRYVYHTSLNFSKEDLLDNGELLAIAQDYLRESGYTNNQYMIFRHYDADHPHIHLLVNRITFDGDVVSDSNNYKKSEAILRKLEYQYNLIPVEQSSHRTIEPNGDLAVERGNNLSKDPGGYKLIEPGNNRSVEPYIVRAASGNSGISRERHNTVSDELANYKSIEQGNNVSQRAPTKDELEMVTRTGKPSEKMLLQELMNKLLSRKNINLQDLIRQGERVGIHFLFNQAATGRVTGITYFHNGFKIKGQALGNRFKWAELQKKVDYEQIRDSQAISEANGRTTAKYGNPMPENNNSADNQHGRGVNLGVGNPARDTLEFGEPKPAIGSLSQNDESTGSEDIVNPEKPLETKQDVDFSDNRAADFEFDGLGNIYGIEISDDVDDEAVHGKHRRGRQRT
jgi:hypothetical protein